MWDAAPPEPPDLVQKATSPPTRREVVAEAIVATAKRRGLSVDAYLATGEGQRVYEGYRAL